MIPPSIRIYVYTEPVDMRLGFDGLALLARTAMAQDPRSGYLLIFASRRSDRLKALWWEQSGYCLLYKRAHQHVFELPAKDESGSVSIRIDGRVLVQLIAGVPKVRKASVAALLG